MPRIRFDPVLIQAVIAGALPFAHLHDIAEAADQHGWKAWSHPISVDLLLVAAWRRMRTLRTTKQPAGAAWTWFVIALTASLGASHRTARPAPDPLFLVLPTVLFSFIAVQVYSEGRAEATTAAHQVGSFIGSWLIPGFTAALLTVFFAHFIRRQRINARLRRGNPVSGRLPGSVTGAGACSSPRERRRGPHRSTAARSGVPPARLDRSGGVLSSADVQSHTRVIAPGTHRTEIGSVPSGSPSA